VVRDGQPDIGIVDITLPDGDGAESGSARAEEGPALFPVMR
jgi:DNA-binding NarL/FixJ family response regulator